MNYPKTGIFIKPESSDQQKAISDILNNDGLFFDRENGGLFVGAMGERVYTIYERIKLMLHDASIVCDVHVARPEASTEGGWYKHD